MSRIDPYTRTLPLQARCEARAARARRRLDIFTDEAAKRRPALVIRAAYAAAAVRSAWWARQWRNAASRPSTIGHDLSPYRPFYWRD